MARTLRQKQRGRANELALLVNVDRKAWPREFGARTVSNFNEYQAVVITHDEIDFTETAAEIAPDWPKAATLQMF